MKDENRAKKQRGPRDVKQSNRDRCCQKSLNCIQTSQPCRRARAVFRIKGLGNDRIKNAFIQSRPVTRTVTRHQATARVIKQAHQCVKGSHEHKESNQRCLGSRSEHAVIDLQHEQWTREREQVHKYAEHENRNQQWSGRWGRTGHTNWICFACHLWRSGLRHFHSYNTDFSILV